MKKQNKKPIFTLIEILLILVILILITSIILVNISTIKYSAQKNTVLTELRKVLPVFESCFTDNSDILCVTNPFGCDGSSSAKPLSDTSICFDSEKWPNVEKNNYVYAGFAIYDKRLGKYSFGVFRDKNMDGISDDGNIICCSDIGCSEQYRGVVNGSACVTRAGL